MIGDAWKLVQKAGRAAKDALDPDRVLIAGMQSAIEVAKSRYAVDLGARWKEGTPLKLLLAGYSGTRNTGADVRVEEMIRQFRHLFGDDHLELSVLTLNPALSDGYFRTARQMKLPDIYPKFLYDAVHAHHGVVACEGSMFKSKFATALSTMMVGALGLAVAEGKLAIGYGGEAGDMHPALRDLLRNYVKGALVLTRNEASTSVLAELGMASSPGTDTAWTFEPAPASHAHELLRKAGWDGEMPILGLCAINPFWWPVRPDVVRGAMHAVSGAHGDAHYKSVYFHKSGDDVRDNQARYLDAFAEGVRRFRKNRAVFPVVIAMEQLDREACEDLAERLGGAPVFGSDEHDMYSLVSVLRECAWLASSRYHAVVTSMPGLVPSVGITMDERIRNLMADRGQPHLALEVDDPDLADHLHEALEHLDAERDEVRRGIGESVVRNLRRMGEMGQALVEYVRTQHPTFPLREGLGKDGDPWAHLPALAPNLRSLVQTIAPPPAPRARAPRRTTKEQGARP